MLAKGYRSSAGSQRFDGGWDLSTKEGAWQVTVEQFRCMGIPERAKLFAMYPAVYERLVQEERGESYGR